MLATISDTTMQWYFRRQNAKAVIARGDRPDAHISALETETACLIVTGGRDPQPHVLGMAADLEVPIVKVAEDTYWVLDRITELLPTVRFRQRFKLAEIASLLGERFDFAALYRALGLRQEATP
jgi:BioD-like phosphotransacetylase family protein